ncbi:malate synthase A [Thioalkalivibrio sp. XN8]|uniref:malate synthase A n=1 Tax=Thioalkalivibrio sp. XN8 TaxID=2712863 RepID=UPI0013EAFA91|nr:malate synthase A [Thioalkalivibrio sp. XN8]NGP54723.1 malate synthase A [Thioalkalivibrio sp. XN8]
MTTTAPDYQILGPVRPGYEAILSPDAMAFLAELAARFGPRVEELLARRSARQAEIDRGQLPDFLPETADIRMGDWRVGEIPADLQDRRVEITGPVDRKMIINALNSGAKVFMADFEDSMTPAWDNLLPGQIALRDAVARTISFTSPEGKEYKLKDEVATLFVRPRGWHLYEKHVEVAGRQVPGGLFDFGLYLFHNAAATAKIGSGPYFYLPKLESHLEARLWAEVFRYAEDALGLARGTIKCTVLIETILAAFEIDEILYELREHIVGLNCGRWDYIFSFIKKFQEYPEFTLPDRHQVTMATHFLRSYSQLVIKTCHRRGALAIGGMAAQIPIKGDPEANEEALAKVRADKEREAGDGHDGTWVAHPGLVPVAMEIFDRHMPAPNQLDKLREDVHVTAADLLRMPEGEITEAGLRSNISVGIQYMAAWLGGNGCVPLYNLMEDAATAEIARAQIWQWIKHPQGVLDDGRKVTFALYEKLRDEEMAKIRDEVGAERFASGHYAEAAKLLDRITVEERCMDFLTLVAYEAID